MSRNGTGEKTKRMRTCWKTLLKRMKREQLTTKKRNKRVAARRIVSLVAAKFGRNLRMSYVK